jgi:hypothetical protein
MLVTHLRSEAAYRLVAASPELFDRGLALHIARPDKAWSLTDCVSFVVMSGAARTGAARPAGLPRCGLCSRVALSSMPSCTYLTVIRLLAGVNRRLWRHAMAGLGG